MVAQQNMMQVVTQAATEVMRAGIMAAKEAKNPLNATRSIQVMPRIGGPALEQPRFNMKASDTYQEL